MQEASSAASAKESALSDSVEQWRAALKQKEDALAMIETEVDQLRTAFADKEAEISIQRDAATQARDDAEHKCLTITIEMDALRASQKEVTDAQNGEIQKLEGRIHQAEEQRKLAENELRVVLEALERKKTVAADNFDALCSAIKQMQPTD